MKEKERKDTPTEFSPRLPFAPIFSIRSSERTNERTIDRPAGRSSPTTRTHPHTLAALSADSRRGEERRAFYDDGSPVEPDGNVGQVRRLRSHTLHAVGGDAGAIHVSLGTHKFARTPINRRRRRERDAGRVRFAVSYSQRRGTAQRCGLVWESRWNLSPGRPRVVTKASGVPGRIAITEPLLLRPVCSSPRI